jgi:hypothetical protein
MVAFGLREGTRARKETETLESPLMDRLSHPGISRLKLFEKTSDSARLKEQAYAERIGRQKEMSMAKNICAFLCLLFTLNLRCFSRIKSGQTRKD